MDASFSIQTERLELRDFTLDDFDAVHDYAVDPEVSRYMPWGPNKPQDTRDFIQRSLDGAAAKPRESFELAIVERATGQLLGGVGLSRSGTNGMLGYCLRRDAWGRGVAPEAASALVDYAFANLSIHRVWAGCDPENGGSIRVLEKLGMRREGHLKEETLIRGEFRDTLIYAVLVKEWGRERGASR